MARGIVFLGCVTSGVGQKFLTLETLGEEMSTPRRDRTKGVRREIRLKHPPISKNLGEPLGGVTRLKRRVRTFSWSQGIMVMNKTLLVNINKITFGKDGKIYLAFSHPLAKNYPSLLIESKKWEEMQKFINKEEEQP